MLYLQHNFIGNLEKKYEQTIDVADYVQENQMNQYSEMQCCYFNFF